MIGTWSNIRFYLVLSLGGLLFTIVPASAQTKEKIVEAWQQQVRSFQTLQHDYEVSSHDLMHPFGEDAFIAWKQKFALSGNKYYMYLKWSGNTVGDASAMASTYNGDYSQKLLEERGKITVYRSQKEDKSERPYISLHPLTTQYQFAFMPKAPRTIGTLKEPETWEHLTERILAIRPSTRNGIQGFTVDIKIPQNRKIYKVFVDENTLWPHYWSVTNRFQDDKEIDEVAEEMAVNTITTVGEKDAALKFPSQIIFRELRKGRLVTQVHINVVPKSLKINEPVPDDIFTLAPQNATFVDADERERIYEQYRNTSKQKIKDKSAPHEENGSLQLPRAEDDPANKIATPQDKIKVGQAAPDFSVTDANGKTWKLSDFKGEKAVVLTFFPKCFTGGCANHLSSLRDHQAEFDQNDVQIFAVSVDAAEGEKGQKAFAERWKLMFPLIPDTQRTFSKLYGAVQKDDERAARMTFLIDKVGVVRFVDTNVNVQTHGKDVLTQLQGLGLLP